MDYQGLKTVALPILARIAADVESDITARIAAMEAMVSRAAEITGTWSSYSDSERAEMRAAFAIDAETLAACGFIPEGV